MFMLEEKHQNSGILNLFRKMFFSDLAKFEAFHTVIYIKLISEECDTYLLFKKFLETSKILEYYVIVLCKYKYLCMHVQINFLLFIKSMDCLYSLIEKL